MVNYIVCSEFDDESTGLRKEGKREKEKERERERERERRG